MICIPIHPINPTTLNKLLIIIISNEEPKYSLRYADPKRPRFEEQFEDSEANHSEVQ